MVSAQATPPRRRLARDWMAGIALFAATAGVVLWQNAHVAVLFDLSYILNTATRIAQGQVPYRDFPLAHAPLTFLFQAMIIRLTGRVFFHHVIYVAIAGGLGTVLTWRIALETLRGQVRSAWMVALLMAAPITLVGIYCIVPNPEYDCDCAFWILIAIWLMQKIDAKRGRLFGFVTGVALCVPVFFKQNMGLPFLAVASGGVLLLIVMRWLRREETTESLPQLRTMLFVLVGVGFAMTTAAFVLHWTAGIGNYIQWTVRYAAHRRLPGTGDMLGVYSGSSLLWMAPSIAAALLVLGSELGKKRWAQLAAFALLAAPFLFPIASLLIYDDADSRGDSLLALWPVLLFFAAVLGVANLIHLRRAPKMRMLMPLILLAAIQGTFLSQQLWGSTYAIWPLLAILLAEMLASLAGFTSRTGSRSLVPGLSLLISATLLVCGGSYTISEERLSYARLPDGPPAHSAFPQLAGLATPGPYLPEIDELLRYAAANIPFDDGLILLPGEEPFYFVTNRVSRFPVPFFDPTIDPYSPAEIVALVKTRNIRWLIVKRDLQTRENPAPDGAVLLSALEREFTPVTRLQGYEVFERDIGPRTKEAREPGAK